MPSNLNALIRYKTINSCLYGGRRKWSIGELIERCSEALAEYRGRYDLVSERTIRDDIRVMRSDILGYNAPIRQQKGLYYYSDPSYSIMTISLTDSGLVERIIRLLLQVRKELNHPEIEMILDKLAGLQGDTVTTVREMPRFSLLPGKKKAGPKAGYFARHSNVSPKPRFEEDVYMQEAFDSTPFPSPDQAPSLDRSLNWGEILTSVFRTHGKQEELPGKI